MKKIFFSIASVFLLFPATILANFTDVPAIHSFYEDINYVKEEGIVNGYADGTYKPNALINRAEFTKIIIGSTYSDSEIKTCNTSAYTFSDVSSDDWFSPYVCMAKQKGVINGYTDGTFQPNKTITIPEAMKIIFVARGIDSSIYEREVSPLNPNEPEWYEKWGNAFLWNFVQANIAGMYIDPRFPNIDALSTYIQLVQTHVNRGEMAYFISSLNYERFMYTYKDEEIGVSLQIPSQYKSKDVIIEDEMRTEKEIVKIIQPFGLAIFSQTVYTEEDIASAINEYLHEVYKNSSILHNRQHSYSSLTEAENAQNRLATQCVEAAEFYPHNNRPALYYITIPIESPYYEKCGEEIAPISFYADDLGKIVGYYTPPEGKAFLLGGEIKSTQVYNSFEILSPEELGVGSLVQSTSSEIDIEKISSDVQTSRGQEDPGFIPHSELSASQLESIAQLGIIAQYTIEDGRIIPLINGEIFQL